MQPSRVSAGSLWPLNQGPRTGANERTALRPSPRSGAFPYTRKPDGLRRGLNSCASGLPANAHSAAAGNVQLPFFGSFTRGVFIRSNWADRIGQRQVPHDSGHDPNTALFARPLSWSPATKRG